MSIGSIIYTVLISPLQMFFEFIFGFAQRFTTNPGYSIIVLSLAMNFLVLPLYKRADAMQAEERDTEARLHDGIARIKKAFKGDERMMILQTYYRQNHYKTTDAFKGSISLFLEIPFFIAAYQFLSHLSVLQGTAFGPITDLGAADGLLNLGGMSLNLLPILMTVINVISCIIYTKGYPLKTKIQLYAMAAFFLFFLYDSPAGLLFYWTLNNLFSLLKNVFYKLKDPKKVLDYLSAFAGIGLAVFTLTSAYSFHNKILLLVIAAGLMLPVLYRLLLQKHLEKKDTSKEEPSTKMFFLSSLLLVVIIGILIPASVMKSSPQEFVNIYDYHNPVWNIVSSFCLAFGTFMIWFGVFYWLASKKGKVLFEKVIWCGCGAAIVDYMFFGTKLGILSSTLQYEETLHFAKTDILYNIGILVLLCIVMIAAYKRYKKLLTSLLLIGIVTITAMSAMNINTIYQQVLPLEKRAADLANDKPHFTLSKTGKNVIVLMLDRAMGPYVPYMFHEKPELMKEFDGFTYYGNMISFGGTTNFATPALYGGYEYTPEKLNKRSDELLKDKQNEALKVMPVLFDQNGYNVTVCDPTYAGYQLIPDLSIYDEYPDIHKYITLGRFNDVTVDAGSFKRNNRNFFCYSLMKSSPLAVQTFLYNDGKYYEQNQKSKKDEKKGEIYAGGQTAMDTSIADGVNAAFLNAYNVLRNLNYMTEITDEKTNSFTMMSNDTTHEPMLLQEPQYEPAMHVDNTAYDTENAGRFEVNGRKMIMENSDQYAHYEANMATMIQLGKWFDYLREQGVYDNTRIILVSDHGRLLNQFESLRFDEGSSDEIDLEFFTSLLMVKDFNSQGFTTSNTFMTDGDVPTIATSDLIQDPVNPMTGNAIDNSEKTAGPQNIFYSRLYDIAVNNGTQFIPDTWLTVQDNIWDIKNWKKTAENATSPNN